MKMSEPEAFNDADLRDAFPAVDPGAKPLGARILVQLRRTKQKATSAGIILVEETRETEKWNNMVAKVIEIGPLAFKKQIPGEDDPVLFMVLNDHEVIAKITGNPLTVRAFV